MGSGGFGFSTCTGLLGSEEHAVKSPSAKTATTNFFMATSCRIWVADRIAIVLDLQHGFLFGTTEAGTRRDNDGHQPRQDGQRSGREVDSGAGTGAPVSHLPQYQQGTSQVPGEGHSARDTGQSPPSIEHAAGCEPGVLSEGQEVSGTRRTQGDGRGRGA